MATAAYDLLFNTNTPVGVTLAPLFHLAHDVQFNRYLNVNARLTTIFPVLSKPKSIAAYA